VNRDIPGAVLEPPRQPRRDAVALGLAAGVFALALLLGAALFVRLSHGVAVTWRVPTPTGPLPIATTFERRPVIPTRHRVTGRLLAHYPFARLGVPKSLPDLDAVVEADLLIPPGPPRVLRVATPNLVELEVDGRPAPLAAPSARQPSARPPLAGPPPARLPGVTGPAPVVTPPPVPPPPAPPPPGPAGLGAPVPVTRPFAPGLHRLRITWRGPLVDANGVGFALKWRAGTEREQTVPALALTPPPAHRDTFAAWVFAGVALFGALLAWLVFRAARVEPDLRRARLFAVGVALLLALGATARAYDFQNAPDVFENDDWMFATWNGWSLLESGTTRGWSSWAAWYGDDVRVEKLVYFESHTTWEVITPYLEHPPLLHVLVGAAARLGGAAHWAHARLWHARVVPLLLGVLSLALLLAVARRLSPRGPAALFAGTLYAFVPFIVLQSREVKEEALLVPLLLASLLFFLRWRDDGERASDLAWGALCAGAATLAKVPGASFVPAYVLLVLAQPHRPWRAAFRALGLGAAVSLLLFAYGALVDWPLFLDTLVKQSSGRPTHWNLFPRWVEYAIVDFNQVGRGWLIFLWLAFVGGVRRDARAELVLGVPLVAYMVAISLSSGSWTFGWYAMPLHALLCLGAGRFLADLWERPDLLRGALFMLLLVMYGLNFVAPMGWYASPAAWMPLRRYVAAFVIPALTPFALATLFPGRAAHTLARGAVVLGLLLFVGLSLHFVAGYESFSEEFKNFDRNLGFNP
jgi:4-amino-4-deoxy-L-arabinose transferase-like glycosyltransferase